MAKATSKKKVELFEDDEFVLPTDLISLYDLASKLWYDYFKPKEKLTPAEKKDIMSKYNQVAEAINKQRPGTIIKLTPSTQWVPTKMYDNDGVEDKATVRAPGQIRPTDLPTTNSSANNSKTNGAPVKTKEAAKAVPTAAAPAPKQGSIIDQILALHKAGKSNKEIIEAGYNKSTVARQVSEYKKRIAAGGN